MGPLNSLASSSSVAVELALELNPSASSVETLACEDSGFKEGLLVLACKDSGLACENSGFAEASLKSCREL